MIKKNTFTLLFFFCFTFSFAQAPTADFRSDIVSGCSPIIVNFQDLSSGNPTAWSWDFGNGSSSTKKNPSTTFFTPGTYTVTLTSTNSSGSHTTTKQAYITVYDPPKIDFVSDKNSGCAPYKIQFTDLSSQAANTTNTNWLWDFGDGTQSTQQNPQKIYRNADIFTVTLRVTNDKGCSKTVSKPNFINIIPGVVINYSNSLPAICSAPAAITFTNNSSGPGQVTYTWSFGDGGSSTQTSPTHTYTKEGKYTVSLAATSDLGCTDTLRKDSVVMIGGYKTDFTVPKICEKNDILFTNASTPSPASFLWQFADGTTSTVRNPVKAFPTAGTFDVKLINNYGNCTDSVTKQITVIARPVIDFQASETIKCQPTFNVNFTTTSTAASYDWDFGDGTPKSTQAAPAHSFTKEGNFTVTLVASNGQGCSDTVRKADYIKIKRPTIKFTNLPVRGCTPYAISPVAVIESLDNISSYKWDFGDGAGSVFTNSNPTYTYTRRGDYTISLTITTSTGCTETYTMGTAVKVGSKPTAAFTVNQKDVCASTVLQFTDLSTPLNEITEWLWLFEDGGRSSVQNPSYEFKDTGWQDVRLVVVNNGCPSDTLTEKDFVHIQPPIALFEYRPDCSTRNDYVFTDKSIFDNPAAASWEWDFGDGSPKVSGQNPPGHSFPGIGTYRVSLIVRNGSCSDTMLRTISILDASPNFTASSVEGCKPFHVTFTPSSPKGGAIVTYNWNFVGIGTSSQPAADPYGRVIYPAVGNYEVRLTTIDSFGCQDTRIKSNYIRVNGPVASFASTTNQGCKGMTVGFDDKTVTDGLHNVVEWKFDFGDSTFGSLTRLPLQHTYDTVGNFNVKMVVKDAAGCLDSVTNANFVRVSILKANWDVARQTCPDSAITFNNYTSSNINYTTIWNFGNGDTSHSQSIRYAYKDTGFYSIKLLVQDEVGCKDSSIRTQYVQVGKPIAAFTANNFSTYCTPFEAKFTNTSTYYNSWSWDLGTGTSTQRDPVNYYTQTNDYDIKLRVTSPGGCKDSVTHRMHVYNPDDGKLNYTYSTICTPLKAEFEAFTEMNAHFVWDFGDGNVLDTTNVNKLSHTYVDFGNFLPRVIMTEPSGNCGPRVLQGTDTIQILGAKAKFRLDDYFFCDSGYVQIIDSTTFNDPILNYTWDFGDGQSSNEVAPLHPYTNPGFYSVLLTVTTRSGCVDSLRSAPVKIVASPLIHIASDTVICVNERMRHAGVFDRTDTSAVQWQWQFPNGNTAFVQLPSNQQYSKAGNYFLSTLVTNSSGCTDTDTVRIRVNPLPTVSMPSAMTMQLGYPITIPASYTSNVVGYTWFPPDGLSCTDCPQPVVNPKVDTKYTVSFVDSNGCKNTGEIQIVAICKDANMFVPNTFSPNGDGSNDIFYVRGRGLQRVKSFRIFNRWGEIMFEKKDFPVNDISYGWDGKFRGGKPHPDVYIYQVEAYCDNGQLIRFDGNVALIQ